MFQALSFIPSGAPTNNDHKVPPGIKLGHVESTKESPIYSTVSVAWAADRKDSILWESEPSLRHKIARAEARAAMLRAVIVGASAGTAVYALTEFLPLLVDWTGAIIGLVAAV